jgi:hypothetical protein
VSGAAADLIDLIEMFCGGRCRVAVLDAARRSVDVQNSVVIPDSPKG